MYNVRVFLVSIKRKKKMYKEIVEKSSYFNFTLAIPFYLGNSDSPTNFRRFS